MFPVPAKDAENDADAVLLTPHLTVELTPAPEMIIPLPPPDAVYPVNKPFAPTHTAHPDVFKVLTYTLPQAQKLFV